MVPWHRCTSNYVVVVALGAAVVDQDGGAIVNGRCSEMANQDGFQRLRRRPLQPRTGQVQRGAAKTGVYSGIDTYRS